MAKEHFLRKLGMGTHLDTQDQKQEHLSSEENPSQKNLKKYSEYSEITIMLGWSR